jgi:Putative prokaryotic signal transducing protein
MIAPALEETPMEDEAVDEREWQVAKVVESTEEASFVAGFLNSNGIPAEVESLHVDELPVNLGALGEVRVLVPAERLAEALVALAEIDAKALSEADTESP